jgi:DNA polymerase
MNERLLMLDQVTKTWYKTFGIDHVFYRFDSISKPIAIQDKQKKGTSEFTTIESLREAVYNIDCNLKRSARNTVFSDGDPSSDIMIIGEAPGNDEDMQGVPFVGQSGLLLNNMLLSVGLKRTDVYITNVVFWRPPGNRTPSLEEISLCMPYVENHIKLVKPKVLLLLGGVAVKSILNTSDSITRIRGRKMKYNGIDAIATFHPAYLLRSPNQKSAAFSDFIELAKVYRRMDSSIGNLQICLGL